MSSQSHWRPAYIGIGSNLDSPRNQVEQAISSIAQLDDCFLAAKSSLYRSAPMGSLDQPDYLNAVVAIMTVLTSRTLLEKLQEIERDQGRTRDGERWGPRTLDLDLLVHGNTVIAEPDLSVPHPGLAERNFVLLPFAEIAPHVVVPGLGRISELCQKLDISHQTIEKLRH